MSASPKKQESAPASPTKPVLKTEESEPIKKEEAQRQSDLQEEIEQPSSSTSRDIPAYDDDDASDAGSRTGRHELKTDHVVHEADLEKNDSGTGWRGRPKVVIDRDKVIEEELKWETALLCLK
jgi:hypothetical protein